MNDNCIFCNIVSNKTDTQILYEDKYLVVFNDLYPKADKHLLVVPREHIESLKEIEPKHSDLMSHIMINIKNIANKLNLGDFRTIANSGKNSGQEIFHLHFHLLSGGKLPGF